VQFLELLRQELRLRLDHAEGGSLLRVFALDMAHLIPLARRELLGIRFDVTLAQTQISAADEDMSRLDSQLVSILGRVNFTSPVEVKNAFKEKLGIDLTSTAKTALRPLMENCEAARLLRGWRKARALKAELQRLLEHVHPDGRLYPQLDSLGSDTGRIISSRPTLNNLSVDTGKRACILPDSPDDMIINPDFSREEPTIFAVEFKVKRLLDDINAGRDIYQGFAAEIYKDLTVGALSEGQLVVGKTHFLAIGYGEKPQALIRSAWEKEGRIMSEEEANRIFRAHMTCYPEIHEAIRRERHAARLGKIRFGLSKLGRRRLLLAYRQKPTASFISSELTKAKLRFFGSIPVASRTEKLAKSSPPEGKSSRLTARSEQKGQEILAAREQWIKWEEEALPEALRRIAELWAVKEKYRVIWAAQILAINFKIQAGGSDVLRWVEIKLEERLPASARVIFSNHDEVLVSCPRDLKSEVAEIIRATMCKGLSTLYPGVNVVAKVQFGNTWQ
jgi:DNA polymerase I-like protein with 3'-5' exonuclease and polymerase domains